MVTNQNQFYNGHTWKDIQQRVANHKPDKLSQGSPTQSEAWEARQAIP